MKKLIEINYSSKKDVRFRDFGLFKSKKTIKIDQSFWQEYVYIRQKFEVLHRELEIKVK